MQTACRKCGATKTETVSEGSPLVNNLARVFGYELRQCSRCRRLRLLKRRGGHRRYHRPPHEVPVVGPGGGEGAAQQVSGPAARGSAGPATEHRSVDSAVPDGLAHCPRCGSKKVPPLTSAEAGALASPSADGALQGLSLSLPSSLTGRRVPHLTVPLFSLSLTSRSGPKRKGSRSRMRPPRSKITIVQKGR